MKIDRVPGEFAFKALFKDPDEGFSWKLSDYFYFSLDEAKKDNPDYLVLWPVEVYDDGTVYIVDKSEYE